MSPTNKAVCFFAFVGSGVVAEKGVINIMNVHCYLAYGESYLSLKTVIHSGH